MLPRPRLRRLPGDSVLLSLLSDITYMFVLDNGRCRVAFCVAAYALRHVVACTTAREQEYHRYKQSNYRDYRFRPCWFRRCPFQYLFQIFHNAVNFL